MMKRFLGTTDLLLICCLVFRIPGYSQEVLVPASSPVPPNAWADQLKSTKVEEIPDTIELPFFDDFSGRGTKPSLSRWTDEYAFINNSYTVDQVTIGVATLDAVDSKGNLNGTGDIPFESDFLSSVPVNLEYPGRNDIYLSFFYQPGGLGDIPETGDSLVVEFWTADSGRWESVWSDTGHQADTFRQVFIPVGEERFRKKGFRFRFKNYASLPSDPYSPDKRGNVDHWHIDYVYLDTARSPSVTVLKDVSMISPLPSMLKNYEALPWTHFNKAKNTEIEPSFEITYRNNDTVARNVTRMLKITDLNLHFSDSVNGGTANVEPGVLNQFQILYIYPLLYYDADSAVLEVQSYLITETQDFKGNDTVIRHQVFSDYYSYDDGSAENGYGLRGEGTLGGMVAFRYKTYLEDTLRAVRMYFNRTQDDATDHYFRLAVWDHDEGTNGPGTMLYSHEGTRPDFSGALNRFTTYELDTNLVVSDIFYIGWIKTTETILNVGFDRYLDNSDKIFYNIGQDWINTSFTGSLMLRPVLGKRPEQPAGLNIQDDPGVRVYPNPAAEYFLVEWPPVENPSQWKISLIDLHGKIHYRARGDVASHPVDQLPQGFYILRLDKNNSRSWSRKLMILR